VSVLIGELAFGAGSETDNYVKVTDLIGSLVAATLATSGCGSAMGYTDSSKRPEAPMTTPTAFPTSTDLRKCARHCYVLCRSVANDPNCIDYRVPVAALSRLLRRRIT
jgi:hypothetical protein